MVVTVAGTAAVGRGQASRDRHLLHRCRATRFRRSKGPDLVAERAVRSQSLVFERDDADRRDVGRGFRGASAPEEGSNRVDRNEIDRVRVKQAGLEHPGIETGRACPSSVGNLDPTPMDIAQRVGTAGERVNGRRDPGPGLEPGAHRAHQSQPCGIRGSSSPAELMLDHRSPESDGPHDARWGPGGSGALGEVQGTARMDAAATVDVRCLMPWSPDLQERWDAAPCGHLVAGLPGVAHARTRGQETRRRGISREVPDAPADDRFVAPLDEDPLRRHTGIVGRPGTSDKRRARWLPRYPLPRYAEARPAADGVRPRRTAEGSAPTQRARPMAREIPGRSRSARAISPRKRAAS